MTSYGNSAVELLLLLPCAVFVISSRIARRNERQVNQSKRRFIQKMQRNQPERLPQRTWEVRMSQTESKLLHQTRASQARRMSSLTFTMTCPIKCPRRLRPRRIPRNHHPQLSFSRRVGLQKLLPLSPALPCGRAETSSEVEEECGMRYWARKDHHV